MRVSSDFVATCDSELTDVDTVVTAFPERWHAGSEDTLLDTIRQGGIKSFTNPEQLIAHILYQCSKFIDEYRYAGFGTHILDIFENEIARLVSPPQSGVFLSFLF